MQTLASALTAKLTGSNVLTATSAMINKQCATARPHRPPSANLRELTLCLTGMVSAGGGSSPVLVLFSPGVGPVELERGGTLVLVLLLGFFSMFVSLQ